MEHPDSTAIKPGSDYSTERLTPTQQTEWDRRVAMDSLPLHEGNVEQYLQDVRTRRHLSWY